MKELLMPQNFDGQKYFNAHNEYPQSHKEGFLLVPDDITQEEVDTYVTTVDDFKSHKISRLWSAANVYEQNSISGSAPAKMLQLAIEGDERAVAIGLWIQSIWANYYIRRDEVEDATTIEELEAVSEDFSSVGPIPYSVKEVIFGE